jgi:nucleoside 2-deoxyribosyltransferase
VQAYISGALLNAAAIDRSRALYERFAHACRAAGWEAYVPHQHADPVRDAHLSNLEVAERDVDQVTVADVIVAYVGEPSLGVGAEVAIALRGGKRVFLVAEAERRVSRFLLGLAELHPSQAQVLRYQTEDEAAGWITEQLRTLGSDSGVRPQAPTPSSDPRV